MDSIPPKKENQERVKTLKKSINLELSPFDYFCFMGSKRRTLFEGLSKPKDFHKHIFGFWSQIIDPNVANMGINKLSSAYLPNSSASMPTAGERTANWG